MKILCIADHPDPIVYSINIKHRFKDVDLVISCGDLPLSYYDFIVSNLNRPLAFVFGNHNLKWIHHFSRRFRRYHETTTVLRRMKEWDTTNPIPSGVEYIDGRIKKIQGLILVGLGGSIRYNNGINQYTDRQMWLRIIKLIPRLFLNRILFGRYCDILVTHAPPKGIHDLPDRCHTGFTPFLWFLRTFTPSYLIHGHIHLWEYNQKRSSVYHKTTIVNAYNHTVVEVEMQGKK
ncbi:MAG: metallophosphoesterase [Spirochaetales bacterium]|nr:metallophosphoesterase [Spirochaetales bacterium]